MDHQWPTGITPHVVENGLQLDLSADKRLTATLLGEPFVFALFDFQFAGSAVRGSSVVDAEYSSI